MRMDLGFRQKPGRDEGERSESRETRCERKEWIVATEARGKGF